MMEAVSLSEAVQRLYGGGICITNKRPVSGGDINRAYVLELSNGERIFMKANSRKNLGFFRAEAEGLQAMRSTNTVKVPAVLAIGTEASSAFLLLEYLEEGERSGAGSEELGRALALMHLADTGRFVSNGKYGFYCDNFIGASEQSNLPTDNWVDFFIQRRLMPQFEKASGWFGKEEHRDFDSFLGNLTQILSEPAHPSLLHGDLWSGNYMIDQSGAPWLIDPAVYVGHAEADLAMTELFGGFDRKFYDAYNETAGIDPGYPERRDIYNLYHLLNHLNLFGGSYLHSVQAVIKRYC